MNEENYLPLLFESLKKQRFPDYEIIVADAGSKDRTVEIAKKYNCKIVKGGSPAQGRNNGAKLAKGDFLLFLDADVILPEDFFKKTLDELKKRKLKIATFSLMPCRKDKFVRLLFNIFYNLPIFFMERTLPHAAMGILISKDIFDKIKGFDETIKMAEDHDLARRAEKLGKYGVLRSTKIFISERRFETDGWLKTFLKYILCGLYMIFQGPIRKEIFEYKFNHYSKKKKKNI